jgi:hypothetical protein
MGWRNLATLGVVAVGWLGWAESASSEEKASGLPKIDLAKAWFKPHLMVNADPVCESLLSSTHKTFSSNDHKYNKINGFTKVYDLHMKFMGHSYIERDKDDHNQLTINIPGKRKIFVYYFLNHGCGGACEEYSLHISDVRYSAEVSNEPSTVSTPASPEWEIMQDQNNVLYFKAIVNNSLEAYKVQPSENFKLSCRIALKPDNLRLSLPPQLQASLNSTDALNKAVSSLAGGEGNLCGSMQTRTRWATERKNMLNESLYRPWAVAALKRNYFSKNSYGDYNRIEENLKLWSLGGLREYHYFKEYQTQLRKTTELLSDFHAKGLGLSSDQATRMAEAAIKNAIAYSFGFYMHDPIFHGEINIRTAILERRPIAEIKNIELKIKPVDSLDSFSPQADNILNIAIEYPEALRYLLEKGADPNAANAFGKTPLMYAAQHNQLEAARILLAAGADPNATTIIPSDSCYYSISTSDMTPLHYAARYAGLPLIKLLVESGAQTFHQTNRDEEDAEHPLDWLNKYTSKIKDEEQNPNLAAADVNKAAQLLNVPTKAERTRLAADMVAKAEAEYAKGKAETAYRNFKIALAAEPDNQKAIAALPLVALKVGHVGPAVKAANHAVKALKTPSLLAAAWFNKGLVCNDERSYFANYDGARCESDKLYSFVKAWQIEPKPARASKIKGFFADSSKGCTVNGPDGSELRVRIFSADKGKRIYILHKPTGQIEASAIKWSVQYSSQKTPTIFSPKTAERIELEKEIITMFTGEESSGEATIHGKPCKDS